MAVGAARRDVLEQFLAEAVLISMGGGVAGILIGVAIPLSVQFFTDDIQIPISLLSIAVAFRRMKMACRDICQEDQLWPSEAARSVTASTARPTTGGAPTRNQAGRLPSDDRGPADL